MVTTNKTGKRVAPPYASWAQVKSFLDTIKALNPKVIDADYLRKNQMGGKDPSVLLTTIKFLGLVDERGNCKDKLDSIKVKGQEQYQQALHSIVRESYANLFEAVDVEQAGGDLIYNQMRSVYGCSTRIARAAAPLFISLCKEASITIAQQPQKRALKTRVPERKPTAKADKGERITSQRPFFTFSISIQDLTEEQIVDQIRKARNALLKFEQE